MPGYNKMFELSVEDMELIEDALRRTNRELSSQMVETAGTGRNLAAASKDIGAVLRGIHDLLGRIHNQKTFYRPRKQTYIGG